MKEPIEITVDSRRKYAYVVYKQACCDQGIELSDDGEIVAELDGDGAVIGIEVENFDSEKLSRARTFAQTKNLLFPADNIFSE